MDELDSAIEKLIEYGKTKKTLTWDELNGLLPPEIINSDKMETVLTQLAQNNIQVEEDDGLTDTEDDTVPVLEDDDEDLITDEAGKIEDETSRKRLVYNEKDSSGDDPVRLYLREIGKENLLTADQEVSLSKKMEENRFFY